MSAVTGISGIQLSAASAAYAPTNSADVSAIASSYAESAASGKQDTLSFGYDDDKISAINGSALAGGGGATGEYVEKSSTELEIGSACFASASTPYYLGSFAQGRENSAIDISVAQGRLNSAFSQSLSQGESNTASGHGFAQGERNYAEGRCLAQGLSNSAQSRAFTQGTMNTAWSDSFAQGTKNSAWACSFAQGNQNSAKSTSVAFGVSSTAQGVSFVAGTYLTANASAVVFGTYNKSGNGYGPTGAALVIGNGTAEDSRHDVMVVTKDGEITMYSSTADTVGTGIMSSIRAISAAATGGGVDSATVSAIASSYAESAASGKLDTTAFNSSDFYTTSNPSGFIDSAYVDSAVSSKADSSALSSYALSADVSGTVDLVSTQSANWGGSALALSAGPGVKLEKSGNVLVASTDETVLFSGSSYGISFTETLAENITNFEYLGISISNAKNRASYTVYPVSEYPTNNMVVPTLFNKDVSYTKGIGLHGMTIVFNKTSANSITCGCWLFNFNDTVGNSDSIYLTKIVGLNRTAGV